MPFVGGMDVVGIDEPFASLVVLFEDAVEFAARIRDDEGVGMILEIIVEHAVQSVEYAGAELAQVALFDPVLCGERRAGGLIHESGLLAQRIVDVLENDECIGVELLQPVHDDGDILARGGGDAVDDVILVLRRLEHDGVHVHALKEIVAEYGNVDDVRLAHVQQQPARHIVVEVLVLEDGAEILGEMSGNGVVVIGKIVPSAEHVGIGVLMPEPEGRSAEDALCDGVAEINYLRLLDRLIVVARRKHGDATRQHDDDEHRGNKFSSHNILLVPPEERTMSLYNLVRRNTIVKNCGKTI